MQPEWQLTSPLKLRPFSSVHRRNADTQWEIRADAWWQFLTTACTKTSPTTCPERMFLNVSEADQRNTENPTKNTLLSTPGLKLVVDAFEM